MMRRQIFKRKGLIRTRDPLLRRQVLLLATMYPDCSSLFSCFSLSPRAFSFFDEFYRKRERAYWATRPLWNILFLKVKNS